MHRLKHHWRKFKEWASSTRRVLEVEGDSLPGNLPPRDLVLLSDDGEAWSVAMNCPCGCGQRVELPLIREAKPRWSLTVDGKRRPTLYPSVWLREGCRSHYFIRDGKVKWV